MKFLMYQNTIPLWANIIILVAICIISFWLLAFLVTLIFALIFKRSIKNVSSAINMLLFQRHEVMTNIIAIAESHGVVLNSTDKKAISMLERIPDFQSLAKADRDLRVLSFVHASYNIISQCERAQLKKIDEYKERRIEYIDIEETYRQKSALYNSEVVGYNYWINVFSFKWLYRLLKFKSKDLIV